MAAELQTLNTTTSAATAARPTTVSKKRKSNAKKGTKHLFKKQKPSPSVDGEPRRRREPSKRFLKILQKRARDYNSDESDDEAAAEEEGEEATRRGRKKPEAEPHEDEAEEEEEASSASSGDESGGSDGDDEGEEGGGHRRGVTRFEEGCRAFKVAFLKIMSKKLPDDPLGPILSAHKKLVASKLAEEVEEHKVKGKARKEKLLAAEKGHVKPETYLDEKEKLLIKVATKGVVRLFNAVSKAQNPQKGLNPSRTKDAKVLAKERKQTFLSELKKSSNQGQKGQASSNSSKHAADKDEDAPGWAPLRETYMLGSKLKDWDKMQDSAAADERTEIPLDNSSDEE